MVLHKKKTSKIHSFGTLHSAIGSTPLVCSARVLMNEMEVIIHD